MLPADAVAEVGHQFVHHGLRGADCCAELFEGGRAEQVGPDAIQHHGSPESFLLNGVGFCHPAKRPAQNFTNAVKLIFRRREGFKEIDRMAAVGVANVVFGVRMRFHFRHCDGEKTRPCSGLGTTLFQFGVGFPACLEGVSTLTTPNIMNPNLSSASLRSLLVLAEKREGLVAEIEKVDGQISKVLGEGGGSFVENGRVISLGHVVGNGHKKARVGSTKSARKTAKRGKRGAVEELILAGLKEAGEAGIAVKHLAAKLGIKPQNIHVWLHTTGKKNGLVKALGKGVYRLEESLGMEAPKVEAPKPKVTGEVKKSVRKKRSTGKKQG